ncbi:MAG: hypothetical protein KBS47_02575 [Bacteroidales bacterium]|nr:hypothetical protein [Candidatus Equimonas enterica]
MMIKISLEEGQSTKDTLRREITKKCENDQAVALFFLADGARTLAFSGETPAAP